MTQDPSLLISSAIDRGNAEGLSGLRGIERLVFLISEAEVLCDKDGIDAFIQTYGKHGVEELVHAYARIGAGQIAETLRRMSDELPSQPDELLSAANTMICDRSGYSYEDIERAVRLAFAGGS
jgi:hypothetical protein